MSSSGGRAARGLAIGLAVLIVILVIADRVGDYVAERVTGDTIESSQHLTSRPDVDIAGFPFLTQLATGHYGKVTIRAHDVPVTGVSRPLNISKLTVVLHTVTVSRDFSSVRADHATADATIAYADLSSALGVEVAYAGDGRITARKQVTVLGHTVAGSVTAKPQLEGGTLSFGDVSVDDAGRLGANVTSLLGKVFDLRLPLQGIPFRIRVQSLGVDAQGVQIQLTGRDLAYAT